jgi:UDP-N-acetylmuramoyl-tripeptide--D-alanyl-D-alanine ligase
MSATMPLASDVPVQVTGAHFWTMGRVGAALSDVLVLPAPGGVREFPAVVTDTRALVPGCLFVALRGERFDAHEFLRDAVAGGAAALVVDDAARAAGLGVSVYVVRDTREAYGRLARFRRRAWAKPVIAIGGSNGKTSTKELLAAMLRGAYVVHATSGNLNNEIGVPQTLLALPDDADLAVIEAGTNSPGEIARLRAIIEPDVVVITSIGEEHLEGFGDVAGVLREELALASDVETVVTPEAHPEVADGARVRAGRVVIAGLQAGDVVPTAWRLEPDGSGVLTFDDDTVHVPLRGEHNLRNAMLAFTVARAFGVSIAAIDASLARMPQPSMRAAVIPIGEALLVNDAYNANPPSAHAALALLAAVAGDRPQVAILGTMRELGDASDRMHELVARDALGRGLSVIVGLGEFAAAFRRLAPNDPRLVLAADADDVATLLPTRLPARAAILLKGSRGVRLERLVAPLTAWATPTA